MMIKKKLAIKSLFCLSAIAVATATWAGIWRQTMTIEAPIGDRDTRASVRAAAIEEMKSRASQKVGSIVESTMRSTGSKLTEEIRTVGISLVKIDGVTEEIKLGTNGTTTLIVHATVEVDESELDRRAAAMRSDQGKAGRIRQLTDENETLKRSLKEVSSMLGKNGTSSEGAELLKRQAEILEALSVNRNMVGQSFEEGALIDLAKKDQAGWSSVQMELDTSIFDKITNSPVHTQIQSVEGVGEGFKALIRIGWDTDLKSIQSTLGRHLRDVRSSMDVGNVPVINAGWYPNNQAWKTEYSARVFKYLSESRVDLELDVGGAKKIFPVLYYGSAFGPENRCNKPKDPLNKYQIESYGAICVISPRLKSNVMMGIDDEVGQNPVGIAMSKGQVAKAKEITGTWIVTKADGSVSRRRAAIGS